MDFYNEYNSQTFSVMLQVVKEHLESQNLYEKCTKLFEAAITKVGKRKQNKRTVSKENKKELQLIISPFDETIFFNCFYSVIKNSPDEDLNNTFYSKNYFFNDIIDIVQSNENSFLNFI